MSTSPDWGIPLVEPLQQQPDVTHNVAVLMLQSLAIGGAIDHTNTPGTLTDGNLYVVGTAPTGAWSGKANKLAYAYGGSWYFLPGVDSDGTNITMGTRHEGLRVWIQDENIEYVWSGTAWTPAGSQGASMSMTIPGDQSLAQNAYTIVDFDTAVITPNTHFYSVDSDGRVTIKQTGTYIITAVVYCENTGGATQQFDIGLFAGGALYYGESGSTPVAAGAVRGILRTGIVHVTSANTIVDVRVWTDGTSSKIESAPTINGATPSAGNRLSIARM